MDNTSKLSDFEKFQNLLKEIGQPFDECETLTGYDIECLSDESNGVCIEFDENKNFKGFER